MEELKQCPKCGEFYSSSYRACPFCEDSEDGEEKTERRTSHRRGHRESGHQEKHSARGIIICVLLFALLLMLWYLFGSDIIAKIQNKPVEQSKIEASDETDEKKAADDEDTDSEGDEETDEDELIQPDQASATPDDEEETETDDMPIETEKTTETTETTTEKTTAASALTLSRSDFTLKANESYQLKVNGSTAKATWTSDNPAVATVDETGKVTAVGGGHTTITAKVGSSVGTCIVRVSGTAQAAGKTTASTAATKQETAAATAGGVSFSKEDVTLTLGAANTSTFKLKINGTTATPTWGVSNSSVVSVDQDGTVKGLAKGTATVQATVDGTTLKCIVRVK